MDARRPVPGEVLAKVAVADGVAFDDGDIEDSGCELVGRVGGGGENSGGPVVVRGHALEGDALIGFGAGILRRVSSCSRKYL